MATLNKNFRIKNGLVVEGSTATVNGQNILTETGSDQYIINLIGGTATDANTPSAVVKRDANGDFAAGTITADLAGNADTATTLETSRTIELTGDVTGSVSFDGSQNVQIQAVIDGSFATNSEVTSAIENAAGSYLDWDGQSQLNVNTQEIAQAFGQTFDSYGSADDAETAANLYTDGRETAITTAYQDYADQAEVDAKAYTDARETAITSAYQSYADTAEQDAKDYADDLINDASNLSTEVWSAYKTNTEIGLAEQRAKDHADDAVAGLVGSAPEVLDTIQELATALENNPDIIADLENVAAGKQNTLTPGANIDISNDTISVTGLDAADISDFNQAALSATSAAYDPSGAAADAQTNAEATAQAALDDVLDATTAFTALNVNDEAKQFAASSTSLGSVVVTAYEWAKADYRSAKALVKIDNGTHNEISEILLTLDSSDNVSITEYAIVGTNGSRGTITADVSGSNVRIRVNPVNDSTIKITGTLLK